MGSEGLKDMLCSIALIYASELVVDWIKRAIYINCIRAVLADRVRPLPRRRFLELRDIFGRISDFLHRTYI